MTTPRIPLNPRDLIEAPLRFLAEGVMAAVRSGDVEEAVACSRALHDAIGAKQILALLDAAEALAKLAPVDALAAYADACESEFPELAADIRRLLA